MIFVNYSGRPFMESISENKKLQRMLGFMFFMATMLIYNANDELRETLELVPFPTEEFQKDVMYSLIGDFIVCYSIESICRYFYLQQFK